MHYQCLDSRINLVHVFRERLLLKALSAGRSFLPKTSAPLHNIETTGDVVIAASRLIAEFRPMATRICQQLLHLLDRAVIM
jgi:hypothetical protein